MSQPGSVLLRREVDHMVQHQAHPALWFQKKVPQVRGSVWTFAGSTVQQNQILTHCRGWMTVWTVDFCLGENLSRVCLRFIPFDQFEHILFPH